MANTRNSDQNFCAKMCIASTTSTLGMAIGEYLSVPFFVNIPGSSPIGNQAFGNLLGGIIGMGIGFAIGAYTTYKIDTAFEGPQTSDRPPLPVTDIASTQLLLDQQNLQANTQTQGPEQSEENEEENTALITVAEIKETEKTPSCFSALSNFKNKAITFFAAPQPIPTNVTAAFNDRPRVSSI